LPALHALRCSDTMPLRRAGGGPRRLQGGRGGQRLSGLEYSVVAAEELPTPAVPLCACGPDPTWRGRNGERNAPFADSLVYTGMRLGEGASRLFTIQGVVVA
ncbi:hypothetical protein ACFCZT_38105, partial [Streptomyces sp. NPDC056230]